MIRTFRYPLYPTESQAATLVAWIEASRQLYNAALQERRDAWDKNRVSISRFDQGQSLTEIRDFDPVYRAVPSVVSDEVLQRVDRSFQAFFGRCARGSKPGFPRFKSASGYESIGFRQDARKPSRVREGGIAIPKLGAVEANIYRPVRGTPFEFRIRRVPSGRWFVSVSCDVGEAPAKVPVRKAVGVDLGLKSFMVTSDGRAVENPKYFVAGEEVLARRQQKLVRKRRGSNGHVKAKLLVAKAYERVANQRLDHSRKLAAELYSEFDLVAYEDLDIRGLKEHGKASEKSINDAAWGQFLRCLTSKAENAGKWAVPVDPRGTSQRCSQCGAMVTKTLAERVHRCACGFIADRDHNAALNVLALGTSAVRLAEAEKAVSR